MIPKSQNRVINYSGLRQRPQMEQLVDYLENGQERVKFPDREAKFIRNHPFMTHLDFFDMQEDQERAWEEQKREREAQRISKETQRSAAEVRSEASQTDTAKVLDKATDAGTQFYDISDERDRMTSDEKTRQEQQQENIRRKVEHNLGENPGTIPFIETRASSSQGYSSMFIPGPKISMEHRTTGSQFYTSETTQGPYVTQNLKRDTAYSSETKQGPYMTQNLKRETAYSSETTQGPRVAQNLKSTQYYTSETTAGPHVAHNLKSTQYYTSSTTAKRPVRTRIRIKRRPDDSAMPEHQSGQQAPKREAGAPHPEEPGKKGTSTGGAAPQAPKMSQPESSTGTDQPTSSSSAAAPDTSKKQGVKKETKSHGTKADTSNSIEHWKKQNKGYILDQISKRGHRGNQKMMARMTKEQLAAFIITLPPPK
jgi:hypothetical protein